MKDISSPHLDSQEPHGDVELERLHGFKSFISDAHRTLLIGELNPSVKVSICFELAIV